MPKTRKSKHIKNWAEHGRWRVDMSQILRGKYGRKRGVYVYIVRFKDVVLYVGLTRQSIYGRLNGHMKSRSNLGVCLRSATPSWDNWSVDVISISGNLEFAEKHYIWKHRPLINIKDSNRIFLDIDNVKLFFRNPEKVDKTGIIRFFRLF